MLNVILFGGSGFVGSHLVKSLASRGHNIKIFSRNPREAESLTVCGFPGQIVPVTGNILDEGAVKSQMAGMDVAINLVGALFEVGTQNFYSLHVKAAEYVASAARSSGVSQLIHFSAIQGGSKSKYELTKVMGEKKVQQEYNQAVIVSPGLLFGPQDDFFNKFAKLTNCSPCLPLIGGGKTLFQPVYVGDVAEMVARIVDKKTCGTTYQVVGPEVYSFKELMEFMLKTLDRRRFLVPIPFPIAKAFGFLMENRLLMVLTKLLTGKFSPLLTRDQVELMKASYTSESHALEEMGIKPKTIEEVVPEYLFC